MTSFLRRLILIGIISGLGLDLGLGFGALPAHAETKPLRQSRKLGLGVVLLGPTGLSMNYRLGRNSIDGALSWNLNPGTTLYFHSTFLFRYPAYFQVDKVNFLLYWGFGPRIYTETKDNSKTQSGRTLIAARGVVGSSYLFRTAPAEIFTEFALALNLIPNTFTEGSLGFGVRYYF